MGITFGNPTWLEDTELIMTHDGTRNLRVKIFVYKKNRKQLRDTKYPIMNIKIQMKKGF